MDIANSVISYWQEVGAVVPPQAVKGVFTTGNMDNIDWNPTSTTCKAESVLHGTCMSILQHFPSNSQVLSSIPDILKPEEMGKKSVRPLPVSFTNMEDVALPKCEDYFVPSVSHITKQRPFPTCRKPSDFWKDQTNWLEHLESLIKKNILDKDDWISWAAYFAYITDPPVNPNTKSYMLPLLTESSNSPITVFHCMKTIQLVTNKLNPGQTPVMSCDQPLYTIAKNCNGNILM